MISHGFQRRRKPFVQAFAVMNYLGNLAVHDGFGMDDITAESFADGLMPKTDAEQRNFSGTGFYQRNDDAGVGRAAAFLAMK